MCWTMTTWSKIWQTRRKTYTKEVRSIAKHLHVPKLIKKMGTAKREERGRDIAKQARVELHSKDGASAKTKKKARQESVLKEFE